MQTDRAIILKKILSYIYLYAAFLFIFYDFVYNAYVSCKPLGLMVVICRTLAWCILYMIVNHLLLKRVVGTKILIEFEIILILILSTLAMGYGAIGV